MKNFILLFLISLLSIAHLAAQNQSVAGEKQTRVQVSGVFPHLAMVADQYPRSEAGVGALMPWADRLWVITYIADQRKTGSGTGLYEIDADLNLNKHPKSVVGTYANRLIHGPSNQLMIGPYVIDMQGNVQIIEELVDHRLAATMEHLFDVENKVYVLSMEGLFFEVDVYSLETNLVFNLNDEFMPPGSRAHFKDGFTHHGRVVIANNTYESIDDTSGRLAEWDGNEWKVLRKTAFTEVWSARASGSPMIATGWDKASVILMVLIDGNWQTYRLPKASRAYDHTSYVEWMRIREVETERVLMDVHGMFYEIGYHTWGGGLWAIRPISTHLRIIPDFASWRGMLVLGGNQATPMQFGQLDRNPLAGQPQAGLWFGVTDDLWSFGKPSGAGGVWYNTDVKANEYSDPYLMGGFSKKSVHIFHEANEPVKFTFEVDVIGDGNWKKFGDFNVAEDEYVYYSFDYGYSAEWIRVKTDIDCNATVYFIYQ